MRTQKVTSRYLTIRNSRIHGRGGFAKRDIPKGAKVIEYVGEKVTKRESDRRADVPLNNHDKDKTMGAVYLFELNSRHDIDGFIWYNTARFINHSCDPNCETDIIKGKIWIIAMRDIKKGEELTYNYGYGYEDYVDHRCLCRTVNCMRYILHEDEWPKLRRLRTRRKNQRRLTRNGKATNGRRLSRNGKSRNGSK